MVLTEEQRAVVDAGNGPWAVAAGPGSGKSHCIIQRYARLVREGNSPEDILSMTFSKAAAKSMRDRAEKIVTVQKMDRTCGFSTFHSFALKFATQECAEFPFELNHDPLIPPPNADKIKSDLAKKFEVSWKELPTYISLQKRNRVAPTEALKIAEKEGKGEKLALAYKAYDKKLREEGQLDFDSLLVEMVNLLEKKEDVRGRWSYQFVMSDESQDNSLLEWRLLQLVTKKHGNLVAVGDAAQGVYSFRGAQGDLFLDFEKLFPGAKTLYLSQNFRSSPQIVRLCKKYGTVRDLAERFHTTNAEGPEIQVNGYPSPADEAKDVARKATLGDSGVLSRTNRALRPIEDALSSAGVRYRLLGGSGFWGQPEIRSCLAYLGCAVAPHDGHVLGALRSPFHPSKFIRKTEVAAEIKRRQDVEPKPSVWKVLGEMPKDKNLSSFVHFLHTLGRYRDLPCKESVTNILRDLHAFDFYEDQGTPDSNPKENLLELVKVASRFRTLREFLDYTRKVAAASKSSKKSVAIGTCHSAKGLEFDKVFLVSVNDGILPHKNGTALEEANVFFVGISRAARELHISYSGSPSPFLKDLLPAPNKELDEVFA
jgi:DNA helicase-2/ATP-dependent DNA helicase PcrA